MKARMLPAGGKALDSPARALPGSALTATLPCMALGPRSAFPGMKSSLHPLPVSEAVPSIHDKDVLHQVPRELREVTQSLGEHRAILFLPQKLLALCRLHTFLKSWVPSTPLPPLPFG